MFGVAVLVAVAGAACAGDDGSETVNGDASDATVTMRLIAFKPDTLNVKAATTVTWAQKDAGAHTVSSGTVEQGSAGATEMPDGKFDSREIGTGKSFQFTFDEPGAYPYFCAIHPATMRGEVRVR